MIRSRRLWLLMGIAASITALGQGGAGTDPAPHARFYASEFRSDTIEINLAATGGRERRDELEWKVRMKAGETLVYSWSVPAPASEFYFDFHGESDRNPEVKVVSYRKGMGNGDNGSLVAPFDGIHGWYLQNQSQKPVIVRLRLSGFYQMRADPYAERESLSPLVAIPAGPFAMGSDSGPSDERPSQRIDLPAYSIERTKVTNRQFAEFLNAKGLGPKEWHWYDDDDEDARIHKVGGKWVADAGAEQFPVVEATWFGGQQYCRWAGRRLPTEAEWEKAARGTDGRRFPWGEAQPDKTRAHFGAGLHEFIPVGSLPKGASPYGALDMAGNGWEWVSTAYKPYPYNATDGREDADAVIERVTRGGGHDVGADQLTTTYRGRGVSRIPQAGHHNISFRCAR